MLSEANAAGVPVIAMDKDSCREVLADGKTGFLVHDVSEAVKALQRISEIIPAACRKQVEQNFSIDNMIDGDEAVDGRLIESELAEDSRWRPF